MWQTKYFKTELQARNWMAKNSNKYQMDFIFVDNGFGVEYKPLRKVY